MLNGKRMFRTITNWEMSAVRGHIVLALEAQVFPTVKGILVIETNDG